MTDATATHPPVTDHPTSVTNVPFEPIVGAHLEHTAEPQRIRWAFAGFDVAAAWTTSWLDYTTGLLERRATPLDVLEDAQRFWSTATARPRPSWSTPFEVVAEWPSVRLLDFSTSSEPGVVPTVFLPPQAGHASTIVDYTPEQSQVRTALEQGLTRLFVLDWLEATPQTAGTTIEDYIAVLDEVIERVGGPVNLVGDCQGGWLATIYAALRPRSVASLTIGAAPIDFHAGDGAIHDWVSAQRDSRDPMWLYRSLVEANGGRHNGEFQVSGFKMLEPAGELTRLADLWANIDDPDYVGRYLDFVAWFETPQDMAGAFYLWTVEHLFVHNELVAGTLEVAGETVDLARLTMPIHLLAGSNDHITPPEQVWALAGHASTPAEDIDSHLVEAGHLGLFMGRRALKEHWGPLFRSVRERNVRDAAVEARRASAERAATAAPPAAETAPAPAAKTATPAAKTAAAPAAKTAAAPAAKSGPTKRTTRKAAPARTNAGAGKTASPRKAGPTKTATTKTATAKAATTKAAATKAPTTKTPTTKAATTKAPTTKTPTTKAATTKAPTTKAATTKPTTSSTTKAPTTTKATSNKATTKARAQTAPATTASTPEPPAAPPTAPEKGANPATD